MINSTKIPTPHAQVATRTVDGAAVIVLADSGQVNVLNSVGTFIWEFVDGSRSVQEIADALRAEYDVTAEQALQDVSDFLQTLVDSQVVVLEDRAG